MRNFHFTHSIRHMFLTIGGFVVAILLLESDGLENWANRLEPGPLRTLAYPAVATLNRTLQPIGVAGTRDRVLDEAARMGWSDDAVRVARMTPPTTEQASASQPQASHESSVPALAVLRPESKSTLTAAAEAPLVGSVPHTVSLAPLAPIEQGRPRVVVLTGDSMMAVGFGAGLMRKAGEDRNLRILRAFKSGTGLARPDVFNWMDQYPAMLGSEKPDVVIVAIGANDGQSFVVDGKVLLFGSDEWRKTYQSRIANFLAMVESTGARALWVGLPPMRFRALQPENFHRQSHRLHRRFQGPQGLVVEHRFVRRRRLRLVSRIRGIARRQVVAPAGAGRHSFLGGRRIHNDGGPDEVAGPAGGECRQYAHTTTRDACHPAD
jgi:hypothetical protein